MSSRSKVFVVDPNTQASDPGGVAITRGEYARYAGLNFLGRVFLYLWSFAPRLFWKTSFGEGGLRWRRMFEHFCYGNTNPALVIDIRENLIAVLTDLDVTGENPYLVIRIKKEKLNLVRTKSVVEGARFASVALYGAKDYRKTGRWDTFNPIVVDCVVRDPLVCQLILDGIPEDDWKLLETGLSQVPKPYAVGLYPFAIPST